MGVTINAKCRPVAMDEPERYGDDEPDEVRPRYPFIAFADREELVREAALCDGLGVVLLWPLAGPDVRALHRQQNLTLIVDNRVHQDWHIEAFREREKKQGEAGGYPL